VDVRRRRPRTFRVRIGQESETTKRRPGPPTRFDAVPARNSDRVDLQFVGGSSNSEKVDRLSANETPAGKILFRLWSMLEGHVDLAGQKVSVSVETNRRRRQNSLSPRFCNLQLQLLDVLLAPARVVKI
jgi:hypothetical protein